MFRNDRDLAEDAQNWMGDMDRIFLGINSKKSKSDVIHLQIKSESKLVDPADMIDFLDVDV